MRLPFWITTVAAGAIVAGCGYSDSDLLGPTVHEDGMTTAARGTQPMVTLKSGSAAYAFAVEFQFFSGSTDCTTGAGSTFRFPSVTTSGISFTPTIWSSMLVTAEATSSVGSDFAHWMGPAGGIPNPVVCIAAPSGVEVYAAMYGAADENTPPTLAAIGGKSVDEGLAVAFTATATDAQTATENLTWTAPGAPVGAAMSAAGSFSWMTGEADGPAVYTFDVCVQDDGVPALSDCETIDVVVNEVNQPPSLDEIADQVMPVGTNHSFAASAHDPDDPTNGLTFSLNGAPAGATIDPVTGVFSWTPTATGDAEFDVVVTDDGSPNMSASRRVNIVAYDPGGAFVISNGWFESQAGALPAAQSLTGKVMFHFNSMYRGRAVEPVGHVAFSLHKINLDFRGVTQDWLVVDGEEGTATFAGTGVLKGMAGTFDYRVWLKQGDNGSDHEIHVRIWRTGDENDVVYDNGGYQAFEGGAIQIIDFG